jgi:hypothetical protein
MINPFIQSPQSESQRQTLTEDETYTRMYGQTVGDHSSRSSMGLWVGLLLIRMGEKLTKKETQLKSARQHA